MSAWEMLRTGSGRSIGTLEFKDVFHMWFASSCNIYLNQSSSY